MAVEEARRCGFRRVGNTYLVGGTMSLPCDRLPIPLPVCPTCGCGIKVGRGFTRINPLNLFGTHAQCTDTYPESCWMCHPPDKTAYIMLVGQEYTVKSFMEEGTARGISKKIPFIPQEFEVGKTIIYLAHRKACVKNNDKAQPDKKGKIRMLQDAMGIFCAFRPQRIERLFWQSKVDKMSERTKARWAKKHVTIVAIPDGDVDHAPKKKRKAKK